MVFALPTKRFANTSGNFSYNRVTLKPVFSIVKTKLRMNTCYRINPYFKLCYFKICTVLFIDVLYHCTNKF